MKLIRVSARKGGPGSQRCTGCMDQGPFTVRERGAMSNLISLVSLRRYISIMSLVRPPSVHLLYHLHGWQISLPACSPKLYFFFAFSQQELNRISFQTFLTPVAFSDRRLLLYCSFLFLCQHLHLASGEICVCVGGWMGVPYNKD